MNASPASCRIAGIAALALCALGLRAAPAVTLACLLAAWWWALGTVLGCFLNGWMHVLTGGAWGLPVRAVALVFSRRMVWLLPGLAGVLLGMHVLYPWAFLPVQAWTHGMARPAFAIAWLSPGFFTLRLAVYAVGWWWVTRPASFESKGRAALALVACTVLTSLAAVDLIASLVPGWYSSAFGLVAMGSQALGGAAAAVLLGVANAPGALAAAEAQAPVTRDLGNLLLMWCMTWGYLAFMQFLVIWAEDMPREIAWYLPRLQTGWRWVGLALVFAQLVAPFMLLLVRSVKDDPKRLKGVAALLLGATALDAFWIVVPSLAAQSARAAHAEQLTRAWWIAPLAFAGIALLAFGDLACGKALARHGKLRHA